MNRREFARSLTVIACAGAGPAFAGFAPSGAVTHFVRDPRLVVDDAPAWITRLKPEFQHTFERDVTTLWRTVLNAVWRDGRAATAGFTRYAEFFVLSTLAREHGYRVAATDEHAQHFSWLLLPDGAAHDARESALRPLR